MTIGATLDGDEDEEEEGIVRIGQYDRDGNSTGACPICCVSPVYAEGTGGGTCGHYLALYDAWGGQSDWSELPSLPYLDVKWQALCAARFPVAEDEDAFDPHPELEKHFGSDLPLLNAWAAKGLCAAPDWSDGTTREILLTEAHKVQGVGYNTGAVFYELGEGESLHTVVVRLAEHFGKLAGVLEAFDRNG